jgi:uncharacterized membrane protein
MIFLTAFLIGVVCGLRSLTAPAIVCWAARLHWIQLENSRLAFMSSAAAAWLFSVLGLGELIADKLPFTPARTQFLGLSARIALGALSGAAIAASGGSSLLLGVVLGVLGGLAGTFAGYKARTGLVQRLRVPDVVIALLEDAVAIGGGLLLVSHL